MDMELMCAALSGYNVPEKLLNLSSVLHWDCTSRVTYGRHY